MTKKRLLLLASLPLTIAMALGILAMLPPTPGVTKTNYDRIEMRMTKAEVEAIFGGPTDVKTFTTADEITTITHDWFQLDQGKAVAHIAFKDGLVVEKQWDSVPESVLDKIRRWLHLP